MSYNLPGEVNPFEAPRAGIGEEAQYLDFADQDAETIRRAHLGRESNIKSLGSLYYLGAVFGSLLTILYFAIAAGLVTMPAGNAAQGEPIDQRLGMVIAGFITLLGTALNGALGYGLTKFQAWARWTVVVFTILGLLGVILYTVVITWMVSPIAGVVVFAFAGGINGLILWLLVSKKAGMVFSAEYKEIIRKTPHVKQKTSIIVKILLGTLLAVVVLIAIVALISYLGSR
jgi:hypothetical protein